MSWFEVLFLSFIEGATEYIPVSSTGHLILTSFFLHEQTTEFTKAFNIVIQFGAILAVLFVYPERFRWNPSFYQKLLVAFLPAAVIGLLFKKNLELLLDNVLVVAISLILGGVVFILIDKKLDRWRRETLNLENLSYTDCLKIGCAQCLAFVPGVSRSAASMVGGILVGLDRTAATQFSFFLAVPTLSAAAGIKFLDVLKVADAGNLWKLLAGVILSFLFSVVSLKWLIMMVARFGFTPFGYYRILVGLVVIAVLYF